jgi:hypothetical protein
VTAREFAIKAPGDQKCSDLPYVFHLDDVGAPLGKFDASYLHDVREQWRHRTGNPGKVPCIRLLCRSCYRRGPHPSGAKRKRLSQDRRSLIFETSKTGGTGSPMFAGHWPG